MIVVRGCKPMTKVLLKTCTLLVAVVLLLGAFSGGVAAQTSDGDGEMGVCVIGVDSPCNGEQWDGDAPSGDTPIDVPSDIPDDVPSDIPDDVPSDIPGNVSSDV